MKKLIATVVLSLAVPSLALADDNKPAPAPTTAPKTDASKSKDTTAPKTDAPKAKATTPPKAGAPKAPAGKTAPTTDDSHK